MSIEIREGADLGTAVALGRTAAGITQQQLGDQVGLSAGYVSKIESGRTVSLLEHELRMLRRLGATVTVHFSEPGVERGG